MKHLGQLRKLLLQDLVHAGILQSHAVQHPFRAVRDPRRRIAESRLGSRPLEAERAQHIDVVELREFPAVPEGAARSHDRVIEFDPAKAGLHVHIPSVYHMISLLSSTGPSLQIRLLPYFVSQEQPIHAPNPQPIRSSKLNQPGMGSGAVSQTARSIGSGPQA